MRIGRLLDRGESLERRAAALYRGYAASARNEPTLCALWTALAREEDEHAHSIALARSYLEPTAAWRTSMDGWEEALDDVERQLAAAEEVGGEATTARQLCAALQLETSELDGFRRALLAACEQPEADTSVAHQLRLAEAAVRISDDPDVALQAALLRARIRFDRS